jgi:hypothetical protein
MVSWVWNHFKKYGNEKAKCNHCSQEISCKSSNTSGFARHLIVIHKLKKNSVVENAKTIETSISLTKKETIDELIINYIINKMAPLDTVDDLDFRKLINYFEPYYQFMSTKSLKKKITDIYEERKLKLFETMKSLISVSIDFDCWTSLANDSYITVNCHGLTNDWKLFCFNLGTKHIEDSHTSENLKVLIEKILIEFDLKNKTLFGIHDNANNMILVSRLLGLEDIRCFAHTWDLAFKDSLISCHTIQSIISKCQKIVGHFNHSSSAQTYLEREQKRLNTESVSLKQNVETRWGSVYTMLDSINQNKLCIISYFDDIIKKNQINLNFQEK